jgi:serum/glucocorticoid-regulated kinase 2
MDVASFDPDFMNEPPNSVVADSGLSETMFCQVQGFPVYNPANEHLSESVSYFSGLV